MLHDSDPIQFARFLGELAGVHVDEATWDELAENMDLDRAELFAILSRGQDAWDRMKQDYTPPGANNPVLHLCTSGAHEFDIELARDLRSGKIISYGIKEECPCCSLPDCYFNCDESQAADSPESEQEAHDRCLNTAAIDGMESLILALACAGQDVKSPQFIEAIQTTLDAIGNQYD